MLAVFAFTASRGSLDLPTAAPGSPAAAASPTTTPTPLPSATPGGPGGSAAPSPTPAASGTPGPSATPPPSAAASAEPSGATPSATADPRLALLTPCPDRAGCYLYTIRKGDTLLGIAAFFGVPYAEIRRLNPEITDPSTIHVGRQLRIPPPG